MVSTRVMRSWQRLINSLTRTKVIYSAICFKRNLGKIYEFQAERSFRSAFYTFYPIKEIEIWLSYSTKTRLTDMRINGKIPSEDKGRMTTVV